MYILDISRHPMNENTVHSEQDKILNSQHRDDIQDLRIKAEEPALIPEPRLAVVIPVQNSELSIGSLVLFARQYSPHIIVVDDGSHDQTIAIAERAGAVVLNADPVWRRQGLFDPGRLQACAGIWMYRCCYY